MLKQVCYWCELEIAQQLRQTVSHPLAREVVKG
jgi:hypothetical protein